MENKKIIFKQHLIENPYSSNNLLTQEVQIKDQTCVFEIPIGTVEKYSISLKENTYNQVFIMLNPVKIHLKFSDTLLHSYQVFGDSANLEYNETMKLSDRGKYTQKEVNEAFKKIITDNPNSNLNFNYLLAIEGEIDDDEFLELYNLVQDRIKQNSAGMLIKYKIENLYKKRVAPDFVQLDTNQVELRLSDLKGKYILLDFWASWCKPCRKEHPLYLELKKKYITLPFEILSISFDDEKKKWLQAIHEDDIRSWKHASDLKGIGNMITEQYQIKYVPVNYLLNPDGIIIAKNIQGEGLKNILKTIFPDK